MDETRNQIYPIKILVIINIQLIEFPVSAAVLVSTDATSRNSDRLPHAGVSGELCRHRHLPTGQ